MQFSSIVVLVGLVAAAAAQEYYSGKWNHVDTHAIIDNDRLFTKYEHCISNESPTGCPQDALELRRVLPEALKEICAKCSPDQQVKIKDTLSYICQKQPEAFARILAKIDQENKYRPAFEAKLGKIAGGC